MIDVVVLAAGRGSRLGPKAEEVPKWLLPVGDGVIADRQLEGLAAADGAVRSVRVVTGHAAEAIDGFLAARPGAQVSTLFNPQFAELNNWWTVLLALRELGPEAQVAIVNGDLFLEPDALRGFLQAAAAGDEDGVLGVDLERELTDESMKVELGPDGALTRIGKVGIEAGAGEYVGLLFARGEVLNRFRSALEAFVGDDAAADEWYEGAVGHTAAAGARWAVWAMPSGRWVEVDDDGDLAAAEALAPS